MIDHGLREVMRANEKIVALVASRNQSVVATEAGQRVVALDCEPRHLVGIATGMGVYGLYPVAHLTEEDLLAGAFVELFSSASQVRFRSGGQYMAPMATIVRYRAHLNLEPLLLQVPGLRVLAPSNALDFMNLLEDAAMDPDPVVFFIPEKWMELEPALQAIVEAAVGPKQARVVRPGDSITLVAYGKLTELALQVASELGAEGKSIEVIDLRSLAPIDFETVVASVKKTGRLVVLQDSPRSYGVGAELAARVSEAAIESLLAPIRRVAAFDAPNPGALESIVHPDADSLRFVLRNLTDF